MTNRRKLYVVLDLDLGNYQQIQIVTPEHFMRILSYEKEHN